MENQLTTLQKFIDSGAGAYGVSQYDPFREHAIIAQANGPLLTTDFFTTVYGAKVWDTLNNQVKLWNMLRKVPWGPRTGWRNRSGRHTSSQGLAEDGTLPTPSKMILQQISSLPRSVVTPFSVTVLAQFVSGLEGGIGDALATEQDMAETDHVKWINQATAAGAHGVTTTGGATGVAVVDLPGIFKPGDTIAANFTGVALGAITEETVVSHDETTGVIAFTGGGSLVAGEAVVVHARQACTSLDDIVEEDGRVLPGGNNDDVLAYDLLTRTPGGHAAPAAVLDNDGTLRNITLDLLDEAITAVRDAGGEPDLIYTTNGMVDLVASLMQVNQRYMGSGNFQVKVGAESTLPGTQTGFQVATYKNIPVVGDSDAPLSYTAAGAAGGGKIFVLDTRFIEVAVAAMTQYMESRDYLATGSLAIQSLYWTMFELRCVDITKQAKIEDLNATLP